MDAPVVVLSARQSRFINHAVGRWAAHAPIQQRNLPFRHARNMDGLELEALAAMDREHSHRVRMARRARDLTQVTLVAENDEMADTLE